MLSVVQLARALRPPDPVPLTVRWSRPAGHTAEALRTALSERRYSVPGRDSSRFFRLNGSVHGRSVAVQAMPYVIPGVRAGSGAMALVFDGHITPTDEGSRLDGMVSAPIAHHWWWFWGIELIVVLVFGAITIGLAVLVIEAAFCVVLWWAVRHNQRMALRNTEELGRVLSSL
jgi:hypothetical protein